MGERKRHQEAFLGVLGPGGLEKLSFDVSDPGYLSLTFFSKNQNLKIFSLKDFKNQALT